MSNTLWQKFCEFSEENKLFDSCPSILVAYSGGADSTALLGLLCEYSKKHDLKVYAMHIHHGIRGEFADRDMKFCENFCKENGIPFFCEKYDIPELAKVSGEGIEECARRIRYSALENCRIKNGIAKIATAHHANDNLETLIMHIARGSSSAGACGITPKTETIIRPLLTCTREEITAYINENNIDFVEDETNSDTKYTRNFVRNEIIPLLQKINPKVVNSGSRFIESVSKDNEYLDSLASKYVNVDTCSELKDLATPILYRVLAKKYNELDRHGELSNVHIVSIEKLVRSGKEHACADLPGDIRAKIQFGKLIFINKSEDHLHDNYERPLQYGINSIPEDGSSILLVRSDDKDKYLFIKENQKVYKLSIHISFDFDRINVDGIMVRNRREGDTIRIGGMTRSVKKLFCEKKLSLEKRSTLPMIVNDDGILWIPHFKPSDFCTKTSENNLSLELFYFYN